MCTQDVLLKSKEKCEKRWRCALPFFSYPEKGGGGEDGGRFFPFPSECCVVAGLRIEYYVITMTNLVNE